MEISNEALSKVRNELNFRFNGGIDNAISYMNSSSFRLDDTTNLQEVFKLKKNRNVVIFVHDIYDSPHGYNKLLYCDYYCFITELCEEVKNDLNTHYWVKLHPNAISDSNERISNFINTLNSSNISVLPFEISNHTIIKFNPDLIVSVNGTVGLEMAYFEIPVVVLEDNPYMNFNFVHTCSNLIDYYKIIKGELETTINFNKNEIYSFYYQAYMQGLEGLDDDLVKMLSPAKDSDSDLYLDKLNGSYESFCNNQFVDFCLMKL